MANDEPTEFVPSSHAAQIADLNRLLAERDRLLAERDQRLALYEGVNDFNKDICRLVWPRRDDPPFTQATQNLPMLMEVPALAVGSDDRPHLLIQGDNYHALLELSYLLELSSKHKGKFDVIYIDPPYATNSRAIGYKDIFFDHSAWLSMMKPRLLLAREMLAPDGFLAVSIDDNEMPRLVLLLEQIFGEDSTKVVVVKMSEAAGPKMGHKKIHKFKEYVIFAKPGGVKGVEIELVDKEEWDEAYNQFLDGLTPDARSEIDDLVAGDVTEASVARVEELLSGIRLRSAREVASAAGVAVKDKKAFAAWRADNVWRIVRFTNGSGSVMHLARDKAAQRHEDDLLLALRTPTGVLRIARRDNGHTLLFADKYLKTSPGDIWTDIKTTMTNEGGVVLKNGKKPLALLKRIIKAHPKKDAIVLDFFAGSGTTGEAVLELNQEDGDEGQRRFVLVTNNEEETDKNDNPTGRFICHDITYPRLTGKFVVDEPGHYRSVEKDEAREAAAKGAPNLKCGGALGRYGGSLRYFVADSSSHVVLHEEMVPADQSALRVADLASDTLRLATDCYQRVDSGTDEFELWTSGSAMLAVLHRYAARKRLVEVLEGVAGEREIHIYPSLPGGKPSEQWFRERLGGDRVSVSKLPDPILHNWHDRVAEARGQ
jgi:adenine-specific DNA-methyltransferase